MRKNKLIGIAERVVPRSWMFYVAALWLVAGCAAVPVPVLAEVTGPQGLRVRVLRLPWTGEPHDLPVYFASVPVDLQNRGTASIAIHPQDFSLVDRQGTEVVACTMDEAVRTLVPQPQPLLPQTPRMVYGASMAQTRPRTGPESEQVLEGSTATPPPSDPERLALPEGTLKPGAAVRGYLYFHLQDPALRRDVLLRWQQSGTIEAPPLSVKLAQVQ